MMDFKRTPFGNYERMYGMLDYRGRTVLDLGADYGTTAQFFISRGATLVVVSERNPEWVPALEAFASKDNRVRVIGEATEEGVRRALMTYRPQVVKVDCEGCERMLLALDDFILSEPEAWVMETHARDLYDGWRERFEKLGYVVKTVEDWPPSTRADGTEKHVKVITATRGT